MLAEVGLLATIFAFFAALYAIVALVYGEQRKSERLVLSGRNAALSTFAMLLVATGALEIALITEQYQIRYVWSVTSPDMSLFYRLTAIWGSQDGSLLFWSFLMSAFAAAAIWANWRSQRRLMPYATAWMMATLAFFVGLGLVYSNPFERFWITPDLLPNASIPSYLFIPTQAEVPPSYWLTDTARGLNPLLRHFGMAIHPPMLYLGFVGFVIPFSFAMGALASGDLSNNWLKATRFWLLIAWLFLSLGLLLGGRWAYDVLGWGGYWGWDPVENAAFLPWLTGTAFLHSVIIQDKRGMFKTWNLFLVIGTFSAVIFGTFATRSGLVDSVHSFARSGIGMPMFLFWFGMTIVGAGMILWRRNRGELKSERQLTSLFSREALFILNNLVFLALFIAVFWGSFGAPIVSELFLDTEITVGTEYFMNVTPPMFAAAFVLMGVAPLSAWGVTSLQRLGRSLLIPGILTGIVLVLIIADGLTNIVAIIGYGVVSLAGSVVLYETFRGAAARRRRFGENWLQAVAVLARRNPRRYGGYMVHLGITVIGIGVIASTLFQSETQNSLAVGESLTIDNYEMRYDRLLENQEAEDGRIMDIAELTIIRDGKEVAQVRPRIDFFPNSRDMNTMTIAGSHSTIRNDFYVLLVSWDPVDQNQATFKVYINPLINLVWGGGLILILGTVIAVWPKSTAPARVKQRASAQDPVGVPA